MGGYRLWFYFEQQQSDKKVEALIDKEEYDDDQLLTLKVPLSLPYQTDWKEFERVDGEINLDGKIYKYVKRKVQNGELILLCIPDHNKMNLENAKNDYFKYASDLMENNASKKSDNSKSLSFKNISGEYDEYLYSFKLNFNYTIHRHPDFYKVGMLLLSPHRSPEQPPDTGFL